MTALATEPQPVTWTCRSEFCRRPLGKPTGHAQGYCGACAQRWYRAGKPEGGAPPPQEGARRGPASRRAREQRRERHAALRAEGLTIREVAREMGISVDTAEKDAKAIAARRRTAADEVWESRPMPRVAPPPSDPDRWWHLAACRDMPLDLFYGADGDAHSLVREAAAKAVCAGCPVRSECLEDALERRDWGLGMGIKGGMTGEERQNEHRRQLRLAREVAA